MCYLVDCHAHLDDDAFDEGRDALIASFFEQGILAVVNPGCDETTSKKAMVLADKYPGIFACVGTHPHEAKYYDTALEEKYRQWASAEKVVAIGEIGLDYHYDYSPRSVQWEVFERQLQLAKDCQLPVVIHTREAIQDTYDIMRNFGSSIRAIMHSFSESVEMAEKFLAMDYYISLGGIVTFKNAKKPPELAKIVPQNRLLTETDAPYLAPVPMRGKRNIPPYVRYTLEKMAELRQTDIADLARQTVENAGRIYGISDYLTETLSSKAMKQERQ